jgi:hypothetical protein
MKRESNKTSSISHTVMERINAGEVHMRPHAYYTVISLLSFVVMLLLGVVLAYALSIVILWARIQNAAGPAYGARNQLASSAGSFPWLYLVAAVVLLISLVFIMRRYGRLYWIKARTVVLLVVLTALVLGFGLSYTTFTAEHLGQSQSHYCQRYPENCTK